MVGLLYAGDRSLDIGVHRLFQQSVAVINRRMAVGDGYQVEEQPGNASVEFVERMQRNQFGLKISQAPGKFFRLPALGLLQKLFLFQLAEDAPRFLIEIDGAAEHGVTLAHIHCAVHTRPIVERLKSPLMQGFEVGFVESGAGFAFGDESLICLLQQRFFDFVQQLGLGYPQMIFGNVRTRNVDVTCAELIPGHGAVPRGLWPVL